MAARDGPVRRADRQFAIHAHWRAGATFTAGSGSAGLLWRPAATNDAVTVAVSVARAARYPAIEEMFYFGAHPGNFAFEIGNPTIEPEHAVGVDLAVRWRSARASGEISYFRNDISNYLFRRPLTPEEFEARIPEFAERFPAREIVFEESEFRTSNMSRRTASCRASRRTLISK